MTARVLDGVLAVAVLVAAAVLTWMLLPGDDGAGPPPGNTPNARGAEVTSEAAKKAALEAAERAAATVLSYSASTLEADAEAARGVLAGEMLKQYDDTMRRLAPEARSTGRVVRARVVGAAIVSVTERDAKALLFVDIETTGQDKAGQDKAGQDKAGQDKAGQDRTGERRRKVELNRVLVTLRHTDSWLVTGLDSF